MSTPPVAVLHGAVSPGAPASDQDTLVQVTAVADSLRHLGHEVERIELTLDLGAAADQLRSLAPAFVFNLVESVAGTDRLLPLGPMLLDCLEIPYTGCRTRALVATTDKLLAKRLMRAAGIATPDWLDGRTLAGAGDGRPAIAAAGPPAGNPPLLNADAGRFIVKSVTEHASFGLDGSAVVSADRVAAALADRRARFSGEWFAEAYVDGREFNLSLLGGADGPQILPPAEIAFQGFAPGEPRILGYAAKWDERSPSYRATPRHADFRPDDMALLDRLQGLACACWDLFELSGYARVDFRVDEAGRPFVLEVNANPCLSPDAGFMAAAERAGLGFVDVVRRIVADLSA